MPSNSKHPGIGQKGGQEYPVLKSIQTFLKQMAEGGARPAPTVLKELLQNADDAGATELAIVLDERNGNRVSALCPEYAGLCSPALLVRNNRPFRLAGEVEAEHDDFTNILNVAGGH